MKKFTWENVVEYFGSVASMSAALSVKRQVGYNYRERGFPRWQAKKIATITGGKFTEEGLPLSRGGKPTATDFSTPEEIETRAREFHKTGRALLAYSRKLNEIADRRRNGESVVIPNLAP